MDHLHLSSFILNLQKYISGIFLVFMGALFLSPFLMECQLQIHKWIIREQLDVKAQSVTITLNEDDMKSLIFENKHEVKIDGKMFDLVSISHSNGMVKLKGYYDTFEDQLLRSFVGIFNVNIPGEHYRSIVLLFQILYYEENEIRLNPHPVNLATDAENFCCDKTGLLSRFNKVDIPPPRVSMC